MTSDKIENQNVLGKYYTPKPVATMIVKAIGVIREYIGLPPPRIILEPSVGLGAFVEASRDRWPGVVVIGVDIDPGAAGLKLCDRTFIGDFPTIDFGDLIPDLVIGNPPYSVQVERLVGKRNPKLKSFKKEVSESHVRKALSLLRGGNGGEGGMVSLLLRAAFLHPERRSDLLDPLYAEGKISPRITFVDAGTSDNTDYTNYLWFPERDMRIPPQILRLRWNKPKKERAPKKEPAPKKVRAPRKTKLTQQPIFENKDQTNE